MAYLCDSADEEYNKWEPFNRVQLEARDPETCALLRRVWDEGDALGDSATPARRRGFLGLASRGRG